MVMSCAIRQIKVDSIMDRSACKAMRICLQYFPLCLQYYMSKGDKIKIIEILDQMNKNIERIVSIGIFRNT